MVVLFSIFWNPHILGHSYLFLDSESVDDPSVIPESEELELSNPISKGT